MARPINCNKQARYVTKISNTSVMHALWCYRQRGAGRSMVVYENKKAVCTLVLPGDSIQRENNGNTYEPFQCE